MPQRTLLIVDDSPEDRMTFRRYLAGDPTYQYVIAEAEMGEEVFERLLGGSAPLPDCLLLDFNLPDTNGIEFLTELRHRYREATIAEGPASLPCAVVMLTGSGDESAAVAALQAGAQDYLVKARLTAPELRFAVNNACEKFDLARRLHASEVRLRMATEAAGIGTWELYPLTGEIRGDARFRALHDLSQEEPLDREQFLGRIYEADRELVRRLIDTALAPAGDDQGSAEYRVRSGGGSDAPVRWVQWFGQASFGAGPQAERFLGTVMEITDRKAVEEERARLVARQERIAEAVQRSLLLVSPPDSYPGMTVVTQYQSAWDEAMIGGDFFDVFPVAENRIALLVGDATGKGVQAATYTAEIKFALRAILRESGGSPAAALTLLNAFIIENARLDAARSGDSFAAAALAVLDTHTGTVSVSTAGAEPPLILRAATSPKGETVEATVHGPLLGVEDAGPYQEEMLQLNLGDLLVMTTDGLTEARSPRLRTADGLRTGGLFFGLDGLAATIREQTAAATDALTAANLTAVGAAAVARALAWAGDRQQDDVCLMLACRR